MSINKVILVGKLGKDPELRYTPTGTPIVTFSLATSEKFKDRDGQDRYITEIIADQMQMLGRSPDSQHQGDQAPHDDVPFN